VRDRVFESRNLEQECAQAITFAPELPRAAAGRIIELAIRLTLKCRTGLFLLKEVDQKHCRSRALRRCNAADTCAGRPRDHLKW
jgi:hypothetical protein